MIKLVKFFSIGLIVATIIIVFAFVYYRTGSSPVSGEQKNNDKGTKDIETVKTEMLKKNAQIMKSPLSQLLEEGKWAEARNMYYNLSDDKFRLFMMNRAAILFLQKGSPLSKNVSPEELTDFMWEEYKKRPAVQNVAMINISKLVLEYPKKFKELQKKLEKQYYSIPLVNNEKASLLAALLSFRNDLSRSILEDVRSKNDPILLSAAIRALKGWKDPDINNKLIGIARKNKNMMVSAISYKVLAVNGERAITLDVEKLITSKNDMLVEAGLFIIEEMKLKEFAQLVQNNMKDFSYFNKRLAEQALNTK